MNGRTFSRWTILFSIALLMMFFTLLFFYDNKYQSPPPYGKDGVISLTGQDFIKNRPLPLIDGWLLSDSRTSDLPTYIGEFSNLQRNRSAMPPHGAASYHITLSYKGDTMSAALYFPQLFSNFSISMDGEILAEGNGSATLFFPLSQGVHLLTVETASSHGFYSGMYHPPLLGTADSVSQTLRIQCVAYGFAFFVPLVFALFTLAIWRLGKDRICFWLGLLCCCFSLYVSYYFIHFLHLPFESYWYLIQTAALYGLCFCTLRLTTISGNTEADICTIWTQRILGGMSLVLLPLALLIPVFPQAVLLHGLFTNIYYIFSFIGLVMLTICRKEKTGLEHDLTLLACIAFGAGLFFNLLTSNLFEPIRFFWQFEWCGLLLTGLFCAMMAARNKRILSENESYRLHLEELVGQRTAALTNLLQERKAFFADMAHDLKAPVFATSAFIEAIRRNDTEIDGELLHYIDLVEQKQQELSCRIKGFTLLNQMDDASEAWAILSVAGVLKEAYETHRMTSEVQSVYFLVTPLETDVYISVQPRKLTLLLENLIFNALQATPAGGQITLSADMDADYCRLSLADTGEGIPSEELPHIFDRFYVGSSKKDTGSGLGLYIAKCIMDEFHGNIFVSSKLGEGTTFYLHFPLARTT